MNDTRLTIRLDGELIEAIRALAVAQERSPSQEVRLALKNWVKPDAVRDRNGGA